MQTTRVTKGDTLLPLYTVVLLDGNQMDLTDYTVKFRMVEKDDTTTVVCDDVTTGVTKHPTQTFTASATTDRIAKNAHGVKEGQEVVLSNSGGALPAGLSASTRYHATNVSTNSFQLSEWKDGPTIDITGAGTGTHSFYVVGSIQYDWQSADVDEAGEFYAWFRLFVSSERTTVPATGTDWLIIVEQSY